MPSKILSLAVVVATLLLATTIPPSSAGLFQRRTYHLHIINELSGNKVLRAQCNCIDRTQPVTYVNPGTEYMLTFKEHLVRANRWSCYLIKDNDSHVWFVAFHDYIESLDDNVYWAVKDDGVYFRYPNFSKMSSKILSLAVMVATLLLAAKMPPSSAVWWHRDVYSVHIINELSGDKVLWAQCNCIDNSQPVTYVNPGNEYMLLFKEHLFRLNRWSCYLIKDNDSHVWFVAFYDNIQTTNKNVYWAVRDGGVYFRTPDRADELMFQWQAGRSLKSASNL
ncbi:hypothetical protein LINGRAHAP2_LOCUS12979 [Linum grandiflorum]